MVASVLSLPSIKNKIVRFIPFVALGLYGLPPHVSAEQRNDRELRQLGATIQRRIKEADACLPKIGNSEVRFCTGVNITGPSLQLFRTPSLDHCREEIAKRGYRIWVEGQPLLTSMSSQDVLSFANSTKRAETWHGIRVVVFRKDSSKFDCLHELIHVYQWTLPSKNELAPPKRQALADKFALILEKEVTEIEKLEKAGKKKEASAYAQRLQPRIDELHAWESLQGTLDEKDPHFYIFEECRKMGCKDEEWEIALSNLARMRDHLPAQYRARVQREMRAALMKKEKAADAEIARLWRPLPGSTLEAIRQFVSGSEDLKRRRLKDEGIDVVSRLTESTGERMVCVSGKPSVVWDTGSGANGIADAYLQAKQAQLNPDYCNAKAGIGSLESLFKVGKLARSDFEKKAFNYKAMVRRALSEREKLLKELR